MAETADGRRMRWSASILRYAMAPGTPDHITFPAVRWAYAKGEFALLAIYRASD